jgi:glycerol-3-phosphate dehydrogenase
MINLSSRPALSTLANTHWDILVIGGGITGAGILREAARLGQRVLLVEQNDFASGTSSRSSKLVHGGVRYLARLQLGLVREAVRERERLVRSGPGLVERLDFMVPNFKTHPLANGTPAGMMALALSVYQGLAGHYPVARRISQQSVASLGWGLDASLVRYAFCYSDAQTDDARLVLRVLAEGCRMGGRALNYLGVTELLRDADRQVIGARLQDGLTGGTVEVRAQAVINATGPWTDRVRSKIGAPQRLQLLRGSHLVFPSRRVPLHQAVVGQHPVNGRPVYFIPWEGVTLLGTTDVVHGESMDREPCISADELRYLLRAAQSLFPSLRLTRSDIQATFAGVRPIVDSHMLDGHGDTGASASREYAIWDEDGLLTVAGGKLTTFRTMALRALEKLRRRLPELGEINWDVPALGALPQVPTGGPFLSTVAKRLLARYGSDGSAAIAAAPAEQRRPIAGVKASAAELTWMARAEGVQHLEDLLLRRLRLGFTVPDGGWQSMPAIQPIVQRALGWDAERWQAEAEAYRATWRRQHGVLRESEEA